MKPIFLFKYKLRKVQASRNILILLTFCKIFLIIFIIIIIIRVVVVVVKEIISSKKLGQLCY